PSRYSCSARRPYTGRRSSMLKNTTEGRVILPSSRAISDSTPGRCQPTVELEVPKSMPRARAGDTSDMGNELPEGKTAAQCMPVGYRIKTSRLPWGKAKAVLKGYA